MLEKLIVSAGTVAAIFGAVFILSGASSPSDTSIDFVTQAELEEFATLHSGSHNELSQRLLSAEIERRASADALESLKGRLGRLEQELPNYATEENVSELAIAIRDQLNFFKQSLEETDDLIEQHGDILAAISRVSPSDRYVPNILSNIENGGDISEETFREEMRRAVNASILSDSEMEIVNESSSQKQITVNEKYVRSLIPGESWTLSDIPTGNVSTRLAGQQLVNWSVGPPRYSLKLRIIDRGPVTTYLCSPRY